MKSEKVVAARLGGVQKRIKLVPPDGGWGWMVLIGTAISNIVNQSMLSVFAYLYGDALEAMGHQTQGAAIVLSTMLFVSNFGGPIAGVILKLTSPRLVAVLGACFCTSGLFISGFSTNIWHLIFSYGVLLGSGLGFIQNSSFVAINSYFKERKSRAVGLANVGTGMGQVVMPHVIRYLVGFYGFRGACLILSGISLHGICGTLLIQPVEWHLKKVEEEIVIDEKLHLLNNKDNITTVDKEISVSNGLKTGPTRRSTEPNILQEEKSKIKFNSSKELEKIPKSNEPLNGYKNHINNNLIEIGQKKSWIEKLYELFDISLLTSPRFLNVIVGTALAVTSIQNFSLLYPFFLQKEAMMDKTQTAYCMSTVAGADIVGRIILPTFQDKYKIKARWMLIMTCSWLIIVRQILAFQTNLMVLILMSCLYGVGRSMIIVARNIAVSENCTPEQVPSAVGLGMLTMGIIVPPVGYFLGWIRDVTESYVICITAQNLLMVVLLVMWIPDMIILHLRDKRQNKKDLDELQMT